jgi:hypothetical protein
VLTWFAQQSNEILISWAFGNCIPFLNPFPCNISWHKIWCRKKRETWMLLLDFLLNCVLWTNCPDHRLSFFEGRSPDFLDATNHSVRRCINVYSSLSSCKPRDRSSVYRHPQIRYTFPISHTKACSFSLKKLKSFSWYHNLCLNSAPCCNENQWVPKSRARCW